MNQPRTLKAWEIRAILRACDRDSRWYGRRDKALIATGAITGARSGSLVSINAAALEPKKGKPHKRFVIAKEYIKGKKHSEEFAIPPALGGMLEQAMADARAHWKGKGKCPAFVSWRGLRLRREDVTRRIKARAREAGIDPTYVSAHSLRHLAVDYADSPECKAEGVAVGELPDGIETIEVARLFAGHKNRATTAAYTNNGRMRERELKKAVRKHVSGMLSRMILE